MLNTHEFIFFSANCIRFHLKKEMSNDEKCGTILNVFKFHIYINVSMPPPTHTFHRQHEVKKKNINIV